MKIIIYGSQYGTARKYAEELAKRTNIEIKFQILLTKKK